MICAADNKQHRKFNGIGEASSLGLDSLMTTPGSGDNSGGNGSCNSNNDTKSEDTVIDISQAIASAKRSLETFLNDVSEQWSGDSHSVRKSYWRILRARRHLTNLGNTIVRIQVPPMMTADVPQHLSLTTVETSGNTERARVMEINNKTDPVLPLVVVTGPCALTNLQNTTNLATATAAETETVPTINKTIQNTEKITNQSTIVPESTQYLSNGDPILLSTIISLVNKDPLAADCAILINNVVPVIDEIIMKSDEDIAAENAKIYCKEHSTLALLEYTEKMGIIRHEINFQQWLVVIKGYWSALRVAHRGGVQKELEPELELIPELISKLISGQECEIESQVQQNVQQPVSLSYTSTNKTNQNINYTSQINNINDSSQKLIIPDVDLTSDRMHMIGFAGIAEKLPILHPAEVNMTLWGLEKFNQWPTLPVPTNPSYTYEDNPLPGWCKNICVRMGGKSQGSLEVTYSPPERTRRLRNKMEIQAYLTKFNLSSFLSSRFDFRSVFCVCHTPEDGGSYLECAFGRAGCNRWLHSQCVGLGKRKEGELREMETVVCPFCTVYLESIGATDYLRKKV